MKKNDLTPAGWVRLVLYVITVIVGLVAYVAGQLGAVEVSTAFASMSTALAVLIGGTAAANVPKAPDQGIGQVLDRLRGMTTVPVAEAVPVIAPYDGPTTAQES